MKYRYIAFLLLISLSMNTRSQIADSLDHKVYNVRAVVDIPITVGAMTLNYFGNKILRQKSPLDSVSIANLNPDNINFFHDLYLSLSSFLSKCLSIH